MSSKWRRGATQGSLDFALGVSIKDRGAPWATLLEGRVDVACGHGAALSARPAPGEQGPGQEGSPPHVPYLPLRELAGVAWWQLVAQRTIG